MTTFWELKHTLIHEPVIPHLSIYYENDNMYAKDSDTSISSNFIHNCPKLQALQKYQEASRKIIIYQGSYSAIKRYKLLIQQQHERISETRCWAKEARYNQVHTVWFYLYKSIYKEAKLIHDGINRGVIVFEGRNCLYDVKRTSWE